MPIRWEFEACNNPSVVSLQMRGNTEEWVAWWYCGVYKNTKEWSQPHCLVAFRELKSGHVSDEVTFRRVPITVLGQMRLGTIWKDGKSSSQFDFTRESFMVDFSRPGWEITSFFEPEKGGSTDPYPFNIYPLAFRRDKNWLIEFSLASGGKLLIPCLEFYARCYGRSGELKRILTTYPWDEATDSVVTRLYAPLNEQEEENKWKVKLRRRLVNGDVVFLAHCKYDTITRKYARSIYAQIESQYEHDKQIPIFLKIAPWFCGPAQLIVKGIPFDNGKSFLALQVVGCSDPGGVDIDRSRENGRAKQPSDDGHGMAWAGVPERRLVKEPEIIDLTGDLEPDHGSSPIEVQDPDFIIPGTPRVVRDVLKTKADDTSGPKSSGEAVKLYSSGDYCGSGKGIGYAATHAKAALESQGTLRDMWNALTFLKMSHPEKITSVKFFSFESGFCSGNDPKLISLKHFKNDENVEPKVRSWTYLNHTTKRLRGVLLIKVMLQNTSVYFLEIQRRNHNKKNSNGVPKEEDFRGLVFTLNDETYFMSWIISLLDTVRRVCGVVTKITDGYRYGVAAAFNHTPSKNDRVPCEATISNALKKVGLHL